MLLQLPLVKCSSLPSIRPPAAATTAAAEWRGHYARLLLSAVKFLIGQRGYLTGGPGTVTQTTLASVRQHSIVPRDGGGSHQAVVEAGVPPVASYHARYPGHHGLVTAAFEASTAGAMRFAAERQHQENQEAQREEGDPADSYHWNVLVVVEQERSRICEGGQYLFEVFWKWEKKKKARKKRSGLTNSNFLWCFEISEVYTYCTFFSLL